MLTLAVAHRAESFERMRGPLRERGVEARHLDYAERTLAIDDPPWDPDDFDAGFVFPGRAMEGGVLDALLDVPWLNDREAVLTSRNKAGVLAELSREGVPVPESVLVSNPLDDPDRELGTAFERFDPPVVVKPNSTTRGTGVVKVDDPDSFLGVADYLELVHDYRATGDRSYLVQEYLPDARDYRAMVVEGEFVGAVERRLPEARRADGRWKHNVHRGATASGVELDGDLRALAERTAEVLDVSLLGVDLLVTDDRAVVNETNARPTIDEATKYEPDFYDRLVAAIEGAAGRG
jgi:ribosomal protein S6--L-glutamate ligase